MILLLSILTVMQVLGCTLTTLSIIYLVRKWIVSIQTEKVILKKLNLENKYTNKRMYVRTNGRGKIMCDRNS